MGVKVGWETITPEQAQLLLDNYNKMNRRVRLSRVDRYATDMVDHAFDTHNGDSLKFDSDGFITDGQHRLLAQVQANVTLEYLVIRGTDPQSRTTIDAGAPRTFADDLTMTGKANASVLSSIYTKIMVWDTYGGLEQWRKASFSRKHLAMQWGAYEAQVIDTDVQTRRWNIRWSYVGNVGAMQFMYWLLVHRLGCDKRAVERYLSIIAIGSQSPEDEILIKLRTKLQSGIRISRNGAKGYGNAKEEVYHMIRAWNSWLGGQYIGFQEPRNGYEDPYPMPVPVTAGEKL